MKTLSLFAIGALSLLPLGSQALPLNDDFAVELELTLASDYRTRGISQTQNDPAAQAAATLLHSSGLYLGAWTSNVDFGGGLKTRQEVDYYAGWLWQASDAVSLDLGYLKYSYPGKGNSTRARSTGFSAPTGSAWRPITPTMHRASTASRTPCTATSATKPSCPWAWA